MNPLQLQQSCFGNIKRLCENYAKDSRSRKTINYLETRLKSLENQWKDFDNRHDLLERQYEDKTIQYFADDIYSSTKSMYEKTSKNMRDLLQQLQESEPSKFDLSALLDENADEDLTKLVIKQECNFRAIDRAMSKIEIAELTKKWELEDQLSILKSRWEAIDNIHWELEAQFKGTNREYTTAYYDIEDRYDDIRKKLGSKIWDAAHYDNSAPKVKVPDFFGSYAQWISFKDLFMETIHHNPSINNAQKMQHLKSKLKGEAERLVQHLSVSAENYISCWDILSQRYDNRRLQFTTFLNLMMNLPVIQQPDAYNMKKMHDVIQESLNGLANMGINTDAAGPIIAHMISLKLDEKSFDEYTKDLQEPREIPDINGVLTFLESKFIAYETKKKARAEPTNSQKRSPSNHPKPTNNNYPRKNNYENKHPFPKSYLTTNFNCPNCGQNHVLMHCSKFIDMEPTQRNSVVAKLQVCKNCLFSHGKNACKSTKTCRECGMNHHTLLHNGKWMRQPSTSNDGMPKTKPSTSGEHEANHLSNDDMEILLTTIQLEIKTISGSYVTLRALLDQGSQVNLITENAAQLLGLPRKKMNATVSGIGSVAGDCKGRLHLVCKSIHSDFNFETDAMIMKKLTNKLPNKSFEKKHWPHLEGLKLADPDFNISRSVDLLLGAGIYSEIILDGVLKGNKQSPIAQQTHLGWILCGELQTFNCHVTLINIDDMKKFWETEDITISSNDASKDDQCEQYYSKTVRREPDGKYVVKMPLCSDAEEKLGNSKSTAISQFLQLEKRLERNKKLASMYRDFIHEYIELGHMKPSRPNSNSTIECYLPHHGVLREQSTTTKLRVVFNGSQKTTSGYSLNSLQEKGPNLQKDIQALVLKWKSYKYAFTADIEKMYRCIWISEEQQPLQKIIWRESPSHKLQELQLCTVTYGTKSAPWLALRTLQQLAKDDGDKFPAAAAVLRNEFFVDDLLSGHNSLDEAQKLQRSLIDLLKGGGMNLRKWSSNCPKLLENLQEDQVSTKKLFDFKMDDSMKTLGLGWNPKSDTFLFNWNLGQKPENFTKRGLLSEISRLYDPLGWLSPVTVTAKLIFQKVWMTKLAWNDVLPAEIQKEWIKVRTELPEVKNIKLNRWIGSTGEIELLGFCDASEKAYACVVYSRVRDEQGQPIINLLAAKTKVAPLSQAITLPRLELNGALLLSQLIEKVKKALSEREVNVKAWCDSQVVLAWLQGDVARWEKYVANRVHKIKLVIPAEQWNYVKSESNPADCASRGLHPNKLKTYDLWWKGPDFTKSEDKVVAPNTTTCHFTTNLSQIKRKQTLQTNENNEKENVICKLLSKHSSLTRVTRVVAWAMRFSANALHKQCDTSKYLTTSELLKANAQIIKVVQQVEFETEYKQLANNKPVHNKSNIFKLNPYLDNKGIMRVGGRLRNADLSPEMKNPAILSSKGRLTQLVIHLAHMMTLHGGARLTLAYIRQRYWVISGNKTVKDQLRKCVRCHRFQTTNNHQIMADLPKRRVTPSRPFTHTGVDFTGYVDIKLNKGRGVKTSKGYIAIFVCMVTKAVHIELVSDMTTETFLAAFQRMCARRGIPKHMYSDCGTNFIGASRKLSLEFNSYKQALSPEFFAEIGKLEVEWHLNVPSWPTAGGLWEAGVKSMKHHLRRVLGEQKLTYEEFSTLLAQIEACLNSRPLCSLTENPEEFYNYLTPGHFLTGSATTSLPLSDHSDVRNIDIRRRWQLTEHMYQQFWKNWSNDYLTQLQSRSKWNTPTRNLKEGDVVLVKEDNLPPAKWALGRVLQLHPGADGYVRVTTLKTKTGTIKRPIVKLAPLPLENSGDLKEPENQPETNAERNENGKDERASRKKKAKSRPAGSKTSKTILCLLTLCALVTRSYSTIAEDRVTSGAMITSFESKRPVYYDTIGEIQIIHDEWTLLMYYNLTNYWSAIEQIKNYLDKVNSLCKKTDPRYCEPSVNQLYHEMILLDHYNDILLAPNKHLSCRKRRGLIDGVGYVANSLFGILDQQFAEKYHKDIQAIQNNQNYLLDLVKNQTTIVELENEMLRKNENNMKIQFDLIDHFMKQTSENFMKVESEIEVMMATNYYNSAALSAYLLINNVKRIQEMLFDTLTNVYKGHIDVQLLSPTKLIEQLNEISGRLPKTMSLPVDNIRQDIRELYKLLYLRARVTEDYFLFEVRVPLVSDGDFTLNRVMPIPVKTTTGTTLIELSTEYIAVDLKKNIYISLKEADMQLCTQLRKNKYICNKNLPLFNLQDNNAPCEARLLGHHSTLPCATHNIRCKDAWFELHTTNSWLIICCDVCTLRTICDNDVTTHVMKTSGIVHLSQGCVIQSNELTIYSHNTYNSNIKMDFDFRVPTINSSINKIVNMTSSLPHAALSENTKEREIDDRLSSLKEHEHLLSSSSVSGHDVHQYVLGYTTLVAIIAILGWALRKQWLSRCLTRKEHQREDLEMKATSAANRQENTVRTAATTSQPKAELPRRKPYAADNVSFDMN